MYERRVCPKSEISKRCEPFLIFFDWNGRIRVGMVGFAFHMVRLAFHMVGLAFDWNGRIVC
jgi:hypothetical protein